MELQSKLKSFIKLAGENCNTALQKYGSGPNTDSVTVTQTGSNPDFQLSITVSKINGDPRGSMMLFHNTDTSLDELSQVNAYHPADVSEEFTQLQSELYECIRDSWGEQAFEPILSPSDGTFDLEWSDAYYIPEK